MTVNVKRKIAEISIGNFEIRGNSAQFIMRCSRRVAIDQSDYVIEIDRH